jgi:hypothetical protein
MLIDRVLGCGNTHGCNTGNFQGRLFEFCHVAARAPVPEEARSAGDAPQLNVAFHYCEWLQREFIRDDESQLPAAC